MSKNLKETVLVVIVW